MKTYFAEDARDLLYDPAYTIKLERMVAEPYYRPPGLWVYYNIRHINPYAAGSPLLWWFPVPFHPLEVVALEEGFGGFKETDGPLTEREWVELQKLQRSRYSGWARYTADVAKSLGITPEEARLIYHLYTPLRTNGCDPETAIKVRDTRRMLYSFLGFTYTPDLEDDPVGKEDALPRRMEFWGTETREDLL